MLPLAIVAFFLSPRTARREARVDPRFLLRAFPSFRYNAFTDFSSAIVSLQSAPPPVVSTCHSPPSLYLEGDVLRSCVFLRAFLSPPVSPSFFFWRFLRGPTITECDERQWLESGCCPCPSFRFSLQGCLFEKEVPLWNDPLL